MVAENLVMGKLEVMAIMLASPVSIIPVHRDGVISNNVFRAVIEPTKVHCTLR